MTLAFLGEQDDPDAIAAAVGAVAPQPVPLRVAAPAWLPPRRPSVLAVDLEDPEGACGRLQSAVAGALSSVYAPEKRPFRPHVTVARVRRGARIDRALPVIAGQPTFAATSLTLYRSRLSPKGAAYEPLGRTPLT